MELPAAAIGRSCVSAHQKVIAWEHSNLLEGHSGREQYSLRVAGGWQREAENLRRTSTLFRAAGIHPGDRVVSYRHIGRQVSLLYFVARYLGCDARLYDGSWQDWSRHADFPAQKSR